MNEANFGEQPDTPVVDIDLIPSQPVTRRDRIRVMVVVPSLTAREQRNPPIVARTVACGKTPAAPQEVEIFQGPEGARCRIDHELWGVLPP